MLSDLEEYDEIVSQFRFHTSATWEWSDRCCVDVREGVPECCYQIVDGAELTFTKQERKILGDRVRLKFDPVTDLYTVKRGIEGYTEQELIDSMRDGVLADTLECASHPTRPIVLRETVVGVVVISGCNGLLEYGYYQTFRDELMDLWRRAVDLTGVKRYYVTESIRSDWKVL